VAEMAKERLIADFVGRRVWAVVGASEDSAKYGNRVFRSLQRAGYTVYPVNPRGGELGGIPMYPTLASLPQTPDVVNLVVPPGITEQIVRQANELDLTRVWMQPGAESDEAIAYCHEHDMQVVSDACAMVHRRQWDQDRGSTQEAGGSRDG
jgi:predicted CoA-binding protein